MKTRSSALAAVVLALTACASADDFRSEDPAGYTACEHYDGAKGAGGSVFHDEISAAAKSGADSTTPEIRDLVDDRNGGQDGAPIITDQGGFEDACENAGYDF